MRSTAIILSLCSAAVLSFGASWNAKLLDSSCASTEKGAKGAKVTSEKFAQTCAPKSSTTSFAIEANGKIYMLDAKGNEAASSGLKSGAITPDQDGDVHVTVNGKAQGDTITVDSVTGKAEKKTTKPKG